MSQAELNFLHEWIRAYVNASIIGYIEPKYIGSADRADRAFNALLKRMSQLQERLRQDGQHERGCEATRPFAKEEDCDCGLYLLINF